MRSILARFFGLFSTFRESTEVLSSKWNKGNLARPNWEFTVIRRPQIPEQFRLGPPNYEKEEEKSGTGRKSLQFLWNLAVRVPPSRITLTGQG
jgi:hypothetical protein